MTLPSGNVLETRELLEIVLMVCWVAGMCFVRFLGAKSLIQVVSRFAERFIEPPGTDPDDKSEAR